MTNEQLIRELDLCVPKKPRSDWGRCQRRIIDRAISAITNPYEGMTNGEVLEAIFPKLCDEIDQKWWFGTDWWNKLYGEGENDK